MWLDPVREREMLEIQRIERDRFNTYKTYFEKNPHIVDLAIAHTVTKPILSKSLITTLSMMEVPPGDESVEMLADEAQNQWVTQESQKWNIEMKK